MARGASRGFLRLPLVVMAPLLSALLVACSPVGAGGVASAPVPPSASATPTPAPTSTLRPEIRSGALTAPEQTIAPARLRIPDLGVDMPIVDVGVESAGPMELPVDPAVAGWYRYGSDADSDAGAMTIAAHVDAVGYPIGPLARLRDVATGAPIDVVAADGSARTYVVESLTYYEKSTLPTEELFARDGEPMLVLITCGGPFDSSTGHYRDNVVAIARPQ